MGKPGSYDQNNLTQSPSGRIDMLQWLSIAVMACDAAAMVLR